LTFNFFLFIRNRIQTVKVDPSTIQTSPLLIRPTPGVNNAENITQNGNSNGLDKQSLLKSLSIKPSKSTDRATEIANLFQKSEEQISSYQNENLPLVGFSNTNGSSEK
jgi:hypothetical protein